MARSNGSINGWRAGLGRERAGLDRRNEGYRLRSQSWWVARQFGAARDDQREQRIDNEEDERGAGS